MRLSKLPNDKIILLLGGPRSGTTWLGKIFDSHPDTLYRFEPDRVRRGRDLPLICKARDIERHRDAAHDYLLDLVKVHNVTASGSMPLFKKSYRGFLGTRMHDTAIRALRGLLRKLRRTRRPGIRRRVRRVLVPDLIRGRRAKGMHAIIKSVSARGRARLFAEAMPEAKIILVVRDPFGHVAAMMRGNRTGRHSGAMRVEDLLSIEQAKRLGLTPQMFDGISMVERFAWEWAILNLKAIEDLEGLPQARVVLYQDLCANPITVCRDLFEFTGLSWDPATEEFVRSSVDYAGRDPYLRLFRNTRRNANRWRVELTREDQLRIQRIAQQAGMWQFCPELPTE